MSYKDKKSRICDICDTKLVPRIIDSKVPGSSKEQRLKVMWLHENGEFTCKE